MKVGDMVKLNPEFYVREKNYTGILVEKAESTRLRSHKKWIVMIRGRIHPYFIDQTDMEVINEGD